VVNVSETCFRGHLPERGKKLTRRKVEVERTLGKEEFLLQGSQPNRPISGNCSAPCWKKSCRPRGERNERRPLARDCYRDRFCRRFLVLNFPTI